jgi:hypothetical protein
MGGIHCSNTNEGLIYYIYDGFEPDKIPTVPYRTITKDYVSTSYGGYISRLEWGDHADLIPVEYSGSSKYFYADYGYVCAGWRTVLRSYEMYFDHGGLFCLFSDNGIDNNPNSYYTDRCGSRLQYRGNITVIDDPQEFIALPVGF